MQCLIDAIPAATDQKGILDLQARIGAEQGMLQNEQTKLLVLSQALRAEDGGDAPAAARSHSRRPGRFETRFRPTP